MILDANGFITDIQTVSDREIDMPLQPLNLIDPNEIYNIDAGSFWLWDSEIYHNYMSFGFRLVGTDKVLILEEDVEGDFKTLDRNFLRFFFWRFKVIGFNSIGFDNCIASAAIQGLPISKIKEISDFIINGKNIRPFHVKQSFGIEVYKLNGIDLMEVCPLQGSLKTYAARLHAKRLQDLPIQPDKWLTYKQKVSVGNYLGNDLALTNEVMLGLVEQLSLRESMSKQYCVDLMSKSDAQIAEAVIGNEIKAVTGAWPERVELPVDYSYVYTPPAYIQEFFEAYKGNVTPSLVDAYNALQACVFRLDKSGAPQMPAALKGLVCFIGAGRYRIGMGGLHSSEKKKAHTATEGYQLIDVDVESFYPRMIINNGFYPKHLGELWLQIFSKLVETRVKGKRDGNKVIADSLKIVINGTYGKLGSVFSIMYSPDMMLSTTITGQLSLLILIELLHKAGILVVSANTDGIVIKPKDTQVDLMRCIVTQWETACNFKTEETHYLGLYSRDVNNYIAVKKAFCKETKKHIQKADGVKGKGDFANPWNDPKAAIFRFHKNPTATAVTETVSKVLTENVDPYTYLRSLSQPEKFVVVRNIRGGGVYGATGEYLGKVARWYYSSATRSCSVRYYLSGNQVATSEGARPCMDMPTELPADIDYDKYVTLVESALHDLGYYSTQSGSEVSLV